MDRIGLNNDKARTIEIMCQEYFQDVTTNRHGVADADSDSARNQMARIYERHIAPLILKIDQLSDLNPKGAHHESLGGSKVSGKKTVSIAERENITLRRAVDMAQAGFGRWRNGHPFDSVAAGISDSLYDAIRPGAREGIAKLQSLISASQGSDQEGKG